MGRPSQHDEPQIKILACKIEPSIYKRVLNVLLGTNMSKSEFVREAIKHYLKILELQKSIYKKELESL